MSVNHSAPCASSAGSPAETREQTESDVSTVSSTVSIPNAMGLHMRPVMRFVDTASGFEASIRVRKDDRVVDGKNPMELMLLEATQGTELEIQAEGPDAADAVEALVGLVTHGFGEE